MKMTGGSNLFPDPYVQARRVLLDALEVLQPHLAAITLVGAQAIYVQIDAYAQRTAERAMLSERAEHGEQTTVADSAGATPRRGNDDVDAANTGEADDLGVSPYTTDADLALNPGLLGPVPELVQMLQTAGFEQQQDPGIWKSAPSGYTVDLLVPATLGGGGRRAARLPGHGRNVAHKVAGLDGVLVDRDQLLISALEPGDARHIALAVAGPAALLVAKLYKLWERKGVTHREDAKDALDLFRLLRAFPTADLAIRFDLLRQTPASQPEAAQAQTYLQDLFGDEGAYGAQLVGQAVGKLANRDEVIASCVVLTQDLLGALPPDKTASS